MTGTASAPLRDRYDVAIVGLGPVGATLANLLALRGLSVLAQSISTANACGYSRRSALPSAWRLAWWWRRE